MSVYDYIKLLCEEKGLPIKEVETACGLSNGTISKWKVSVPKADILHRISLFFGEPIEYFLTGERKKGFQQEEVIIKAFRSTDEEGRARIVQAALNEKDRFCSPQKKNAIIRSVLRPAT